MKAFPFHRPDASLISVSEIKAASSLGKHINLEEEWSPGEDFTLSATVEIDADFWAVNRSLDYSYVQLAFLTYCPDTMHRSSRIYSIREGDENVPISVTLNGALIAKKLEIRVVAFSDVSQEACQSFLPRARLYEHSMTLRLDADDHVLPIHEISFNEKHKIGLPWEIRDTFQDTQDDFASNISILLNSDVKTLKADLEKKGKNFAKWALTADLIEHAIRRASDLTVEGDLADIEIDAELYPTSLVAAVCTYAKESKFAPKEIIRFANDSQDHIQFKAIIEEIATRYVPLS